MGCVARKPAMAPACLATRPAVRASACLTSRAAIQRANAAWAATRVVRSATAPEPAMLRRPTRHAGDARPVTAWAPALPLILPRVAPARAAQAALAEPARAAPAAPSPAAQVEKVARYRVVRVDGVARAAPAESPAAPVEWVAWYRAVRVDGVGRAARLAP
jgi:hypothetical protein